MIPVLLLLAATIFGGLDQHPSEAVAEQCVGVYAESLPPAIRIGHVRQDGRDLVVQILYRDWTGEIRCALYRDGSLDDVETLNRKLGVLWTEPPMPTNP